MKLEVRLYQKRIRYKEKEHSDRVAQVIAKHYHELRKEFIKQFGGNYLSFSYEDIFSETVLYIIQDKKAFDLSELDILKQFRYRYNIIRYQIIQDSRLAKEVTTDSISSPSSINTKQTDADDQ